MHIDYFWVLLHFNNFSIKLVNNLFGSLVNNLFDYISIHHKHIAFIIRMLTMLKNKIQVPFHKLISTWFFIGNFPFAPGTLASIATYPIYYLILNLCASISETIIAFYVLIILFIFLGYWAIAKCYREGLAHDHQSIVIDEIIGQLIAIVVSFNQLYYLAKNFSSYIFISEQVFAFLLPLIIFRFFDIKKPLGIKFIDQKMNGPIGVILDDIMAGLFTGLTIYIIYFIIKII